MYSASDNIVQVRLAEIVAILNGTRRRSSGVQKAILLKNRQSLILQRLPRHLPIPMNSRHQGV